MNLCSDNHEEVCYEGKTCPACQEIGRAEKAEEALNVAEEKLSELKSELDELKANQ